MPKQLRFFLETICNDETSTNISKWLDGNPDAVSEMMKLLRPAKMQVALAKYKSKLKE